MGQFISIISLTEYKKIQENQVSLLKGFINELIDETIIIFDRKEYHIVLYNLTLLKTIITTSNIKPQILNINFVDFIDDTNMWNKLQKLENKKNLTEKDIVSIEVAMNDLIERKEKEEIFS